MGFWNSFNKIGKNLPDTKEVLRVPSTLRTSATNVSLNKIAVRYWEIDFTDCIDTVGEIIRFGSTSLVLFDVPDCKGAILLLNSTTYVNKTKNNEKGIEAVSYTHLRAHE